MDIDDPSESNESEIQSSPVDVIELSPEDESGLALIATDSESGSEEAQATMLRVPLRDDSSTTFCSHSSPVFCVRACNSRSVGKQFCLTGGQDDRARLRDLSSDKQVFECSAHTESVVACGFSDDGSLFASADMNGDLFAYRLSDVLSQSSAPSTPITPLLSSSCGSELHWLEWHPSSPVLLGGAADGTLWLWHVPSGATKALPGPAAANVGRFIGDGKRAVVAYADASVRVWDLKSGAPLHTIHSQPLQTGHDPQSSHKDEAHDANLPTCLAVHSENVLVAVGDSEGCCSLMNVQTGKGVARFACSPGAAGASSVEGVAFSATLPNSLVTMSLEGVTTVWDLGAGSVRAQWSAASSAPDLVVVGETDPSSSSSSSLPQSHSGVVSAQSQSAAPTENGSNGTTEALSSSASASAPTAIPMDSGASASASTLDAGATCLLVASRAPVAVVGTRAGLLSVWDLRLAGGPGLRPVRLLDGHAAQVLDMCWLPYAALRSLWSIIVD